jgi:hypothetical protein
MISTLLPPLSRGQAIGPSRLWLFAAALALVPGGAARALDVYAPNINPAYASTVATPADGTGQPAAPAGFIHPGVLVNRAQLAEIKRRVAAGIEPQKSAFAALKASPLAALTYTPHPWSAVECGPRSDPNKGCKDEVADAEAAYGQALLWTLTGNPAYARNAIKIMDAWSAKLRGGHTSANGPVQAAWSAEVWPRAAEIIRYSDAGWTDPEIAAFQRMLRAQYLPSLIHGCIENGNKELAMSEALINIGVFNDDRAMFDLGIKMWRGRTPAYIYLKSDGPKPIRPPGGALAADNALWSNKGIMPRLEDGIMQETARDSTHPALSLAAIAGGAETARQQGVDLYAEEGKRIMAALEFQAQYLAPNKGVAPEDLEFNEHPTWEILYNEYHDRLRDSLPKMGAVLARIRPTGINHMMAWETLTHAGIGAVGLPPVTVP